MTYKPYNANATYRSNSPKYTLAPGVIPPGTKVKFVDGEIGRVINGNFERSLIEYRYPGGGVQRGWFDNNAATIVGIDAKEI